MIDEYLVLHSWRATDRMHHERGEWPVIRLLLSVLSLIFFVFNTAWAAPVDDARLKGLAWLIGQQSGDGSWRNLTGLEMLETAAAVEALANAGVTRGFAFNKGVAWLLNHRAYSHDALAKQITALHKSGRDVNDLLDKLIAGRNDASFGWGAYPKYSGSFPDTALAMEAIRLTGLNYPDANFGIGFIVSRQNSNGGWPYFKGGLGTPPSKIVPTAHCLIALHRYKTLFSVQSSINSGIAWLKSQQKAGGGFGEGSSGNVLEAVLAYKAIVTELGTADSAVTNALNFIVSRQQADGSWGEGNALVTMATLAALPSVNLADTDQDGLPDGVELYLGTNPTKPDSQLLAKGNGRSVIEMTTALKLPPAFLNQPYHTVLPGTGSTLAWSLTGTGRLPAGLALDASTGAISGTPGQLGTFNFSYRTSASSSAAITVAQIKVDTLSVTSHQVPALPHWGTLLLVFCILFIAVKPGHRFRYNRS